jgi:hypothetical protein
MASEAATHGHQTEADEIGIGVAELDTGGLVACAFHKRPDGQVVIRLGRTVAEIDAVIAALERCKRHFT